MRGQSRDSVRLRYSLIWNVKGNGGQNKLSTEDQLLVTFGALWNTGAYFISEQVDVIETTVGGLKGRRLAVKCSKSGYRASGKMYQPGWEWKLQVDVMFRRLSAPKKNKKHYHSGK